MSEASEGRKWGCTGDVGLKLESQDEKLLQKEAKPDCMLELETKPDCTLKLFLWLAFHCFCYYNHI